MPPVHVCVHFEVPSGEEQKSVSSNLDEDTATNYEQLCAVIHKLFAEKHHLGPEARSRVLCRASDGQEVGEQELAPGTTSIVYILRERAHVNKPFLSDVVAATTSLRTDNRLIADPEVMGAHEQKAFYYLFSEPIDNANRALLNTPNETREIAIFMGSEALQGLKAPFQYVVVYDNGTGMSPDAMLSWAHRGLTPLELETGQASQARPTAASPPNDTPFFACGDLSMFGMGSSIAGFHMADYLAYISKLQANSQVSEVSYSRRAIYNSGTGLENVQINTRAPLKYGAKSSGRPKFLAALPHGNENIGKSKELPKLLAALENGHYSPSHETKSFTIFLLTNLRTDARGENCTELFKDFDFVCNHLRTMYFFYLNQGIHLNKWFGGHVAPPSQASGAGAPAWVGKSPFPIGPNGDPLNIRMCVYGLGFEQATAGINQKCDNDSPFAGYLRRCLNDIPYDGWPHRPPEDDSEVAAECSMSLLCRLATAKAAATTDLLQSGRLNAGTTPQQAVIDTSAFVVGVRHEKWGDGTLDIQMLLQFMPRRGIRKDREALADGATTWAPAQASGRRQRPRPRMSNYSVLPKPDHHLAVWWKGRLMAFTKLSLAQKSTNSEHRFLPFMEVPPTQQDELIKRADEMGVLNKDGQPAKSWHKVRDAYYQLLIDHLVGHVFLSDFKNRRDRNTSQRKAGLDHDISAQSSQTKLVVNANDVLAFYNAKGYSQWRSGSHPITPFEASMLELGGATTNADLLNKVREAFRLWFFECLRLRNESYVTKHLVSAESGEHCFFRSLLIDRSCEITLGDIVFVPGQILLHGSSHAGEKKKLSYLGQVMGFWKAVKITADNNSSDPAKERALDQQLRKKEAIVVFRRIFKREDLEPGGGDNTKDGLLWSVVTAVSFLQATAKSNQDKINKHLSEMAKHIPDTLTLTLKPEEPAVFPGDGRARDVPWRSPNLPTFFAVLTSSAARAGASPIDDFAGPVTKGSKRDAKRAAAEAAEVSETRPVQFGVTMAIFKEGEREPLRVEGVERHTLTRLEHPCPEECGHAAGGCFGSPAHLATKAWRLEAGNYELRFYVHHPVLAKAGGRPLQMKTVQVRRSGSDVEEMTAVRGNSHSAALRFTVCAGDPKRVRARLAHDRPCYLGWVPPHALLTLSFTAVDGNEVQCRDVDVAHELIERHVQELHYKLLTDDDQREALPLRLLPGGPGSHLDLPFLVPDPHDEAALLVGYIVLCDVGSADGDSATPLSDRWEPSQGPRQPVRVIIQIKEEPGELNIVWAELRGVKLYPGFACHVEVTHAPAQLRRGDKLEGLTVQLLDQYGFPAMLAPPDTQLQRGKKPYQFWAAAGNGVPFCVPRVEVLLADQPNALPLAAPPLAAAALPFRIDLDRSVFRLDDMELALPARLPIPTAGRPIRVTATAVVPDVTGGSAANGWPNRFAARMCSVLIKTEDRDWAVKEPSKVETTATIDLLPLAGPAGAVLVRPDHAEALPAASDELALLFEVTADAGTALEGYALQLLGEDQRPLASLDNVSFHTKPAARKHKLCPAPDGRVAIEGCIAPRLVGADAREFSFEVHYDGRLRLEVIVAVAASMPPPTMWDLRVQPQPEVMVGSVLSALQVWRSEARDGNVHPEPVAVEELPTLELRLAAPPGDGDGDGARLAFVHRHRGPPEGRIQLRPCTEPIVLPLADVSREQRRFHGGRLTLHDVAICGHLGEAGRLAVTMRVLLNPRAAPPLEPSPPVALTLIPGYPVPDLLCDLPADLGESFHVVLLPPCTLSAQDAFGNPAVADMAACKVEACVYGAADSDEEVAKAVALLSNVKPTRSDVGDAARSELAINAAPLKLPAALRGDVWLQLRVIEVLPAAAATGDLQGRLARVFWSLVPGGAGGRSHVRIEDANLVTSIKMLAPSFLAKGNVVVAGLHSCELLMDVEPAAALERDEMAYGSTVKVYPRQRGGTSEAASFQAAAADEGQVTFYLQDVALQRAGKWVLEASYVEGDRRRKALQGFKPRLSHRIDFEVLPGPPSRLEPASGDAPASVELSNSGASSHVTVVVRDDFGNALKSDAVQELLPRYSVRIVVPDAIPAGADAAAPPALDYAPGQTTMQVLPEHHAQPARLHATLIPLKTSGRGWPVACGLVLALAPLDGAPGPSFEVPVAWQDVVSKGEAERATIAQARQRNAAARARNLAVAVGRSQVDLQEAFAVADSKAVAFRGTLQSCETQAALALVFGDQNAAELVRTAPTEAAHRLAEALPEVIAVRQQEAAQMREVPLLGRYRQDWDTMSGHIFSQWHFREHVLGLVGQLVSVNTNAQQLCPARPQRPRSIVTQFFQPKLAYLICDTVLSKNCVRRMFDELKQRGMILQYKYISLEDLRKMPAAGNRPRGTAGLPRNQPFYPVAEQLAPSRLLAERCDAINRAAAARAKESGVRERPRNLDPLEVFSLVQHFVASDAVLFAGNATAANEALRMAQRMRQTLTLEDGARIEASGANSSFKGDHLDRSLEDALQMLDEGHARPGLFESKPMVVPSWIQPRAAEDAAAGLPALQRLLAAAQDFEGAARRAEEAEASVQRQQAELEEAQAEAGPGAPLAAGSGAAPAPPDLRHRPATSPNPRPTVRRRVA